MEIEDLKALMEIERAEREATRKARCTSCSKRIRPIFKATADPLDWFFLTCDTCLDDFCPKCCEVDSNTGKCLCYTCYESSLHTKGA